MRLEEAATLDRLRERHLAKGGRSKSVNLQSELQEQAQIKCKQRSDSSGLNCIYHTVVLECRLLLYSLELDVSLCGNRQTVLC